MQITELRKLGLTEGEIKVYSALLELGETTRTELAKKSGISPSKIYDVANRLLEKGIISSVKKDGILNFSPANPERLRDFLKQKENEINEERKTVEQLLPMLLSQYDQTKERTDVEVFYGWEGLKTAFVTLENSMSPKDESLVFGASIGKNPEQADIFFTKHQQRLEKKGYKVRIIFNEDIRARKDRYKYYIKHKKHEIKFLHQETFTELYIYKDRVLFLILIKKPIAIMVKNNEVVDSFRKFFESMWKLAKR
ncbi:MAG: helix-turn-helix domain-containing protein [Candidatus Micrarchaeota archaeon]|nr:helix-turn-helix domain-containing protein [Candidatus Micrarchaeota archaeon]